LNREQAHALTTIVDSFVNQSTGFSLNGSPGTGKTFTCKEIYSELVARLPEDQPILCGAMTGSASANLPHGSTLHRLFRF
ncbi:hypothetical protein BDR26DRAFT_785500, partial [Obelidium mucronatum]